MKSSFKFMLGIITLGCVCACTAKDPYTEYTIKDNKIVYNTPARPSDQQSMIGFAADPIENIRVGFVGLGMRGPGAVERFTQLEGVTIVALCDLLPERVEDAQKILDNHGLPRAAEYSGAEGYKDLCAREDLDLVYLAVPWQLHTTIAVYAMNCGKHVAVEVPAATSIKECWDLVNTSERTRKHCMMLENCCYDDFELTTLNMAQHGLFGEIVHAEGAYIHNLIPYWDEYQGDWRMIYNKAHHGDVYPTHGLGPVAFALNIHRGDKMDYLVAMDTDSWVGKSIADRRYGTDEPYANGDHTATYIHTRKGKTIEIQHDTYTPRPYDRMYQLTGTEGYASKYPDPYLALGSANLESNKDYENLDAESFVPKAVYDKLMAEYQHPITKDILAKAKQVGGHGGMDFIMDYRLVYCLHNGLPLDQDVYDAAEWSAIIECSEVSILNGSMPVVLPDFTRGEWEVLKGQHFAMAGE